MCARRVSEARGLDLERSTRLRGLVCAIEDAGAAREELGVRESLTEAASDFAQFGRFVELSRRVHVTSLVVWRRRARRSSRIGRDGRVGVL